MPWIADGIENHEEIAVTALVNCGRFAPETFDALVAKPQLQEHVNNKTGQSLGFLCDMEAKSPALWDDFTRKGWVQDGLSELEALITQDLYSMIFESAEYGEVETHRAWSGMINMPFLETVDRFDRLAVLALAQIGNGTGEGLGETMTHPTFADGISDREAKTIAMLNSIYESNSDRAISLFLEPGAASLDVEERVIELPLAGEVNLTIFRRYRHRSTSTMDLLERSVRANEKFMGAPFPDKWVVLHLHDSDDGWVSRQPGSHAGTHMNMQRNYDVEHGGRIEDTYRVLLHETGHYYWLLAQGWIDEGGANFLEYASNPERYGEEIVIAEYASCDGITTLAQLERRRPVGGDELYKCNYQLGEGLFLELYRLLGEDKFRESFRNLYLKRLQDDIHDDCEGTHLDICHVSAAFKSGVPDEVAEQVDEILSRRYGPPP